MICLTTVVVFLLCNAFFGSMRTRVDSVRAHHPNVCFEGGRGSGVRRCIGMGISGNGSVAMKVGSYSCPRHKDRDHLFSNEGRVVVAETTFGLPWHLSVSLLSGVVRNGGSI